MIGGGTLLAALIIGLLVFGHCGSDNRAKPKIDPETQALIDSLKTTRPAFDKTRDSIITIVRHDTIFAKATNASAERSRANAVAAGHVADSLAVAARVAKDAADSAAKWQLAYNERTRERDTLLITIVKKDSVIRYERDARLGLGLLYGADTLRRKRTEVANERLVADIAKLEQPCRVPGTFGKVPCPSRTVTGILSAGLGYLAGRKGP
jgi:hypothetical protein